MATSTMRIFQSSSWTMISVSKWKSFVFESKGIFRRASTEYTRYPE